MRIEERLFENYGLGTKQITERLLERIGKKKTGEIHWEAESRPQLRI